MAKIVVIDTHDGGMVNDPRDPRTNVYRDIQHFDNYTNPKKLTPYRSLKADAVTESTLDGFQIKMLVEGNSQIYGLGRVGLSDNHTQIYKKTSGLPTDVWTTADGTSTSASSVEAYLMFVFYKNYIFGANGGGVWKYGDVTSAGSETFTFNDYTAHVPTGQGIVHSGNGNMYFPSGNLIIRNNGVGGSGGYGVGFTVTDTGATIAAICEYGNYLAIMFNSPNGKVTVGLWDMDETNTLFSEKIDWGRGNGKYIETVEGILCGISTTGGTTQSLTPRVYFKSYEYSGLSGYEGLNTVNIFAELVCTQSPVFPIGGQQRFNELFYFLMKAVLQNGITYQGLWKIFRAPSGQMAVSFDILPENGTSLGNGALSGFYRWGDFIFIAHSNSSGANTVWRTINNISEGALYSATSQWATTINQGMDRDDKIQKKKLLAVGALYEPLPSGASVVVQYRVDGGAWTTIFTEGTTNQVRTEPYTCLSSGAQFVDGFEYEFRAQSTGGGEVTSLVYKYDIIKSTTSTS